MNINEFNQKFCDELQEAFTSDGGRVHAVSIPKNNELLQTATVRFGDDSIGVVIYPGSYYNDWRSGAKMEDIISHIKNNILTMEKPNITIESINRNAAPEHLRTAIVGYERNKDWLQKVPYEKIADMAVFAKWDIDNNASAKVTNEMMALLQMTKEEILQIAKESTAKKMELTPMHEVLQGMLTNNGIGDELAEAMVIESAPNHLQVLSNERAIDGAALIADSKVMKGVREKIGEDFYILPSSIHEVLILPKSGADEVEELKEMVRTINQEQIPLQDQLTNNVYEFDGKEIKIAGVLETLGIEKSGISNSKTHHR